MYLYTRLFKSSVGRKILMAVTGILIIGFLLGHLLGNLQMFAGQEAINAYAAFLQKNTLVIWVVRFGMFIIFLTHVSLAIQLKRENTIARPVAYAKKATVQATIASRTMILSGLVILAFVIYHLLHFTMGIAHSDFYYFQDASGRHDVYSMVVNSFRIPLISISYLIAVGLMALHLRQAIPGFFQSLGWNSSSSRKITNRAGVIISLLLFIGYASIPLGVLLRIIILPGEV